MPPKALSTLHRSSSSSNSINLIRLLLLLSEFSENEARAKLSVAEMNGLDDFIAVKFERDLIRVVVVVVIGAEAKDGAASGGGRRAGSF